MKEGLSVQASSLIFLIGLPGSGKSTFARSLLVAHPNAVIVSTDAIRAQLFGDDAIQGTWLRVWLEVRQQFQHAVEQTSRGQTSFAIYDATNAVRKQRRAAIALARTTGFTHITAIWLNVPLALCLERNQQRSRVVPEEAILQMHRRLLGAPPSLAEGLDQLVECTP